MGSPLLLTPAQAPHKGPAMFRLLALFFSSALTFAQDPYQTDLVDQYRVDPYQAAGSYQEGPYQEPYKVPTHYQTKKKQYQLESYQEPYVRRGTSCRSRMPTSMVESTPKVSSRPRSKTRVTMGSCGASTGFSCQTEGRRLYHTQRTMRMATKLRFVMREKHVLKLLNQTTTSARKVKCGCGNIQSTPNSHMAATDLHAQSYGNCHQENIFQICFH